MSTLGQSAAAGTVGAATASALKVARRTAVTTVAVVVISPAGIGLLQLHHPMLGGAVGAHGAGHQVHGTVLHRAGKVHGQRQRAGPGTGVLQHAVQQQGGRGTAVRAHHAGVARMGVGEGAAVRLGLAAAWHPEGVAGALQILGVKNFKNSC